ncbi:LOW QUALITY PROTEIN: meiosis 1 arrest protein [Anomaloglossus baeobatrachus]
MKGNLPRLLRCLSEVQALPTEGSGSLKNSALSVAVLDSLQQNKQRMQHSTSLATSHGSFVEVTVVSPRPICELLCDLDGGLKDADLSTLRRLLVLQISSSEQEPNESPESPPEQGSHVYDIDHQVIPPNVLSLEIHLKSWLLEHNGEKEKCHLIFPDGASELEVMCDVSPLLNPGLLHGEGGEAYPRGSVMTAGTGAPQAWKVVRAISSSGVCGSMLYGLPSILTPTACWELDWDQLEANQDNFHALSHCLQSQQLSLVAGCTQRRVASAPPVRSHVLVSSSGSAALLLRPLAVRELVLLMKVPPLPTTMAEGALHRVQGVLRSLEADPIYNPLQMSSNLCRHLQEKLSLDHKRHISSGHSRQIQSVVQIDSVQRRESIAPPLGAPPLEAPPLGAPPSRRNIKNMSNLFLKRLKENHLYIKPEKCEFHHSEIQFLGYVLSRQGLNMESVPAVEERLIGLRQILEVLKESLISAQERYKRSAHRFLKPACMFKKLGQTFVGLNGIVSFVACRLKLPRNMKVIYPTGKAKATIAPLHFAPPNLSKRRCTVNDSPSPKRRLLRDEED